MADTPKPAVADKLYNLELPDPLVLPLPGERIIFLNKDVQIPTIVNATITVMYKTVQNKWPGWINILCDNSTEESSVHLQATRWRFEPTHAILEDQVESDTDEHNNAFEDVRSSIPEHMDMPFPTVQNLDTSASAPTHSRSFKSMAVRCTATRLPPHGV